MNKVKECSLLSVIAAVWNVAKKGEMQSYGNNTWEEVLGKKNQRLKTAFVVKVKK